MTFSRQSFKHGWQNAAWNCIANATNFVARRDFAATRFTQNLLLARFSQYCA